MERKEHRTIRLPILIVVCLLGPTEPLLLAQNNIATDRPGASNASTVVPPGSFQFEMGGNFAYSESAGAVAESQEKLLQSPFLMRFGLLRNLELRIESGGFSRIDVSSTQQADFSETGVASPGLGLKWRFFEGESGSSPSLALLFSTNLPAGSDGFRPDEAEPGIFLAANIPAGTWSVGLNGGMAWLYGSATEGRFAQGFGAITAGRGMSPRASWFVELAARGPHVEDGEAQVFADGGFLFLLAPKWQLDIAVLRGISEQASDWEVTGGLSFRID